MAIPRVDAPPAGVQNNLLVQDQQKPQPTFFERILNVGQFFENVNQKRLNLQNRVVTWIRTNITDKIKRIIRLFVFIFTPSAFDPKHPHFVEIINNKEVFVEKLKAKLNVLSLAEFTEKNNAFFNDLNNLRTLSHDIPETIHQLEEFLAELQLYKKPFEIQKKVETLLKSYRMLELELNANLKKNGNSIFRTFNLIIDKLKLPSLANPPREVLKELLDFAKESILKMYSVEDENGHRILDEKYKKIVKPDVWESFEENYTLIVKLLLTDTSFIVEDVHEERVVTDKECMEVKAPMGLRQIGNSCYIDSAMEALLCFPEIRQKLFQTLNQPEGPKEGDSTVVRKTKEEALFDYERKLKLQPFLKRVVSQSVVFSKDNNLSLLEYLLNNNDGASKPMQKFRDHIFKAGYNSELDPRKLTQQNDTNIVVDILSRFFDLKSLARTITITEQLPGMEFYKAEADEDYSPKANFPEGRTDDDEYALQELINRMGHKDRAKDTKNFIPNEGHVCNEELAKTITLPKDATAKLSYESFTRFSKLPLILPMQLKRFNREAGDNVKVKNSVKLPSDGIVDLSEIYKSDVSNTESTKYEIASMIIHTGDTDGGHYYSKVRIKDGERDRYYIADDGDTPKEISQEQFFGTTDAYFVILKRIEQPVN